MITMEMKKMKKIIVNEPLCMGCGACVAIDPDHFEFSSNGLASVKSNENLESNNLANAIDACPSEAIAFEDCSCEAGCQCQEDCNCQEEA